MRNTGSVHSSPGAMSWFEFDELKSQMTQVAEERTQIGLARDEALGPTDSSRSSARRHSSKAELQEARDKAIEDLKAVEEILLRPANWRSDWLASTQSVKTSSMREEADMTGS